MPRKAKPTKHSSGQLAARAKAALTNAGGGKAGLVDRMGGKAGHCKFLCKVCGVAGKSLVTMQAHHEARHSKLPWDPSLYEDQHEKFGGVTTTGVAVRGTVKAKKLKEKGLTKKPRKVGDDGEVPAAGRGAPMRK